jgi:glycosyltransferase involved in cell wall biosynthesis
MVSKAKTIRQISAGFLSKALQQPSFRLVPKAEKNGNGGGKSGCIQFFTTCPEPWGGSEELWARTARQLASMNFQINVNFAYLDSTHPEIVRLVEAGVQLEKYHGVPVLRRSSAFRHRWERELTITRLRIHNTRFAVVSQGENLDGLRLIRYCREADVPYVIICQKASEDNCPLDEKRSYLKESFDQARRVFFVSEHNRLITEERLGHRLTNAEVVSNPFNVDYNVKIPWPDLDEGRFHLACVARLWMRDKGQDILLKVLAQEKWKQRPLDVHCYGLGPNAEAFKEMAELFGVRQVRFCGFAKDVEEIWRRHHALVLPSRHEGLPLALVEAMLCERPVIVTNAGGNTEVVDDGETGFVAPAATVEAFDDALERAWNRRAEWQKIGLNAGASIRQKVPEDPSRIFTEKILAIYRELEKSS